MQTPDANWKEGNHIRDAITDDVTLPPESSGLQAVCNPAVTPKCTARSNITIHPDDPTNSLSQTSSRDPASFEESALMPSSPKIVGPVVSTDFQEFEPDGNQGQEEQSSPTLPELSVTQPVPPVDHPPAAQGLSGKGAPDSLKRPFDCNVCFDLAHDPVVTRCGHLYCWPCLHAWLQQAGECPVCKAQVTRETVVPIYGQGQDAVDPRTKATSENDIPQRPRPERVESARRRGQQSNAAWNFGLFAGSTFTFGIFPMGVGVAWPGTWFNQGHQVPVASDEIFNQLVSLAFLFVAIFVTLGIVFVGDHSPEF
eukprot:Gregarina_sp_Poly_1__11136@NODE_902_length_5777_cov_93_573030_g644_i0_p2_GENE_NODE_902_length_5777_cov_93_573030_g644_i0NODE_902_length_5777_cov_93_573030_g644_i0_p2_ORF_typecomplete_len311_score27_00zfC3HC4_2/PF13923_6/2_7e14zfC3HC4_3/PF13920_6/9_8e13ProkRING_4/PF14447_6/2_6e11zfC3HC4/PF00097_25/2_8e10zfRING_5/PF14634_6/1_1e09zfC3HC4_4/PF15227_6/1_8e08zfRING_UBOX/PF13445_6/1e07zfRING_UBOX/PF13445_6/2_1e02Ubox/PF04564_15/2_6e07zfRING_6/PF14835_6/4_8e07zfRING_2/PF13639_6/1_1e06zfNOSIP/PF15906_5/3